MWDTCAPLGGGQSLGALEFSPPDWTEVWSYVLVVMTSRQVQMTLM